MDRVWDAAALAFVLGGIGLFAFARRALAGLGAGTYEVPKDVSAVARADFHMAQSRFAIWCIAVGILVGVVAAIRHRMK